MTYYAIMNSMFWNRVDVERERLNLTRKDLARLTGISKNTIETWNARLTIPSGDKCLVIALALGVTVEYLLTGDEVEFEDDDPIIQAIITDKKLYAINELLIRSGRSKIDAIAELIGVKSNGTIQKNA